MNYQMQLNKKPFELIKSGKKTIELRLNDEKRKVIKVNDTITFTNRENQAESITAKVINLHYFDSFKDLYGVLPLEKCGYLKEEISTASHLDMLSYYSITQQALYGVVGIEIKLI